ncbi:DUF3891 family protein [Dyadobacter luticola]|uniref:DUF3891 family protein n=1 Tax=Dyadobacter luticola TaxID=1979387 RepID=A0A5R9L4H7_9BACT|nr:DUF3891 family protein [Dyadobacter luticola]TLV03472.1 DUF3891 family protein [Dyadobacter luticola]
MIVNYTEEGWSIVTQRSHGLLAAQICGRWKKDQQPERWVETLIATAEHDDVNDELTEPEIVHPNGGPKNFKMVPFEPAYCDRLVAKALAKGRYVGILIATHIRFLYGEQTEAKPYCAALAKKEKIWIKETKTSAAQVKSSYELLEFCDAFSLIICQQLMQPEERLMEISNGPDGKSYQLRMRNPGELIVSPWPFEEDAFQVNYESRTVKQLAFESSEAFRKALESAVITHNTLTIARNPA